MTRRTIHTLLWALLSIALFSGCSKNDPTPKPVTKTDLLVAHAWHGDQVLIGGVDVSARPEITGQVGQIKTVQILFKKDGTYNATLTTGMGPQTQSGKWAYNADETKLTFELYGEVQILTLTDNNLNLSAKVPFQGLFFDAELRLVK